MKPEKRGARYLENYPAPRAVKNPVCAYVHYTSQGGELLAFRVWGTHAAMVKLTTLADFKGRPDVVPHIVSKGLIKGARLIELPSQTDQTLDTD